MLITHDKEHEKFLNYIEEHPKYYFIPWEEKELRRELAMKYNILGLPTLQIVNSVDLETITSWGRTAIMTNKQHAFRNWKIGKSGVFYVDNALLIGGAIAICFVFIGCILVFPW